MNHDSSCAHVKYFQETSQQTSSENLKSKIKRSLADHNKQEKLIEVFKKKINDREGQRSSYHINSHKKLSLSGDLKEEEVTFKLRNKSLSLFREYGWKETRMMGELVLA